MTRVSGSRTIATPCCGAVFSSPRYASINYHVEEYWTDGFLTGNSAVAENGLRRCTCGKVYLMHKVIETELKVAEKLPTMMYVSNEDIEDVVQQEMDTDLEIVVRRNYWHQLNHSYRIAYRLHRKTKDDEAMRVHQVLPKVQPTLIQKFKAFFVALPPPSHPIRRSEPFTVPPYQVTELQRQNMERLLLLQLQHETTDWVEVAELYREMGQFDEAADAISRSQKMETETSKLIRALITERKTCPMRYSKFSGNHPIFAI